MALPREEQAKFIRLLASHVSSGASIKEALHSLAEDYKDFGLLEVPPSLYSLVPKKFRKGWVSEELETAVQEIEMGRKEQEVLEELSILDEDVRKTLASAVESGVFEKTAEKLADILELEVKLLGELKQVAFGPTIAIFLALIFTYIMVFMFVPKVASSVTHKEELPLTVKAAYTVSQHPYLFVLGVVLLFAAVYLFVRSGVWKSKLSAYRTFEKLRFLNWLKLLYETGWQDVRVFQFLLDAGFSKKWREAIEDALYRIEGGESPLEVFEEFKKRKLLANSDYSFIRTGLNVGNLPRHLEPDLRFLKGETERVIKRDIALIQAFFLIAVGTYIAGLYLGIQLPLVSAMQRAM